MKSIFELFGKKKRIRLGNFTAFQRLGEWVFRINKNRKKKKRGKKKSKRSPKQIECNRRFKGEREFYSAFRHAVMIDHPMWNIAATLHGETGQTGDNYFYTIIWMYIDGNEVASPSMFHFSVGDLSMPWEISLSRVGDIITFTWQDKRECSHARGTDRMLIGILYDDHRGRPTLVDPRALRGHGVASIILNPAYGSRAHLYPFFEREDRTAYSPDRYFESSP